MSMHWGEVPGNTVRDRAVRLAGALAELAQRELLLSQAGVLTPVHARVTDLPGMIEREVTEHGSATLESPHLGARFTISVETGLWEAPTPQVADLLRAKFHR
jgi:hypothetical protein